METKAMGKVIHEKQPFGFVRDYNMHDGDRGVSWVRNVPHGTTEVENRGISVQVSDAGKNPGAYAQACKGRDNPFYPTGMPMKKPHGNMVNPRMIQSGDVS